MNRKYWVQKLGIPQEAETIFYQSPEFYRSDSFRWERDDEKTINLKNSIIKSCFITGVCNSHHKNKGKRQKVCLVVETSRKL